MTATFGDPRLPARFWVKVLPVSSGCWQWHGAHIRNGYSAFSTGRMQLGHRVAYEALVGQIPEGLVVDHLCRNRSCVNPDHLEPVTIRENLMRGQTPAAANAAKTHCPQGHPLVGGNLLPSKLRQGKRCCRTCNRDQVARRTRRGIPLAA